MSIWTGSAAPELDRFEVGLEESALAIQSATGHRPAGFRAPYLLGPRFFDADVYGTVAACGFRWASNREVRYPVEVGRPDRLGSGRLSDLFVAHPGWLDGPAGRAMLVALNARLIAAGAVGGSPREALSWLLGGCPPFFRGPLLEIPLYSPLTAICSAVRTRSPAPLSVCSTTRCSLGGEP
jgi:hypothetical protein